MNFPEEQLGRVGQKFSDIGRKIEYIKTLDLVSCVAEVEQLISTGFTTVSALVNWWFNNSFTKEAIQADAEFERLRKSVK